MGRVGGWQGGVGCLTCLLQHHCEGSSKKRTRTSHTRTVPALRWKDPEPDSERKGRDRALQTPANPTRKPKALRDSEKERDRDSRALTVLPLTTLPRTKANTSQLAQTTSLLQHSIGSQRQKERARERGGPRGLLVVLHRSKAKQRQREREGACKCKHVTTTLVPHVLVWVCVCVCMSSEASSLKELGPRLRIACSQNLTQSNMCNMSKHKNSCAIYPKTAHAKN